MTTAELVRQLRANIGAQRLLSFRARKLAAEVRHEVSTMRILITRTRELLAAAPPVVIVRMVRPELPVPGMN